MTAETNTSVLERCQSMAEKAPAAREPAERLVSASSSQIRLCGDMSLHEERQPYWGFSKNACQTGAMSRLNEGRRPQGNNEQKRASERM